MAREFNFTTATVSDLVSTFGIPMATANDITTRKPRSVAELLEVEGMSTKMFCQCSTYLTIYMLRIVS